MNGESAEDDVTRARDEVDQTWRNWDEVDEVNGKTGTRLTR